MKEIKDTKKYYDSIEIPEELSARVMTTMNQSEYKEKHRKKPFRIKSYQYALAGAAASFLLFFVSLNTNKAFATSLEQIPVVSNIAKVLTIRSYHEEDADKTLDVNLPAIDSEKEVAKKVNAIIADEVAKYTEDAKKRAEEYKADFLATGGTEEEFADHDIEIKVDYDIRYQDNDMVSFVLTGTESWVSAYAINHYYNLDIRNNKVITLKDLLGDNYIEIANESIRKQMEERLKEDPSNTYFDESMDGFTSINADTKFYINEAKNPVIVFDKYEIAPGSMGMPEFEIQLDTVK